MRRSVMITLVLLTLPTWSLLVLLQQIPNLEWNGSLVDSHLSLLEAVVLSHTATLVASVALFVVTVPWRAARSISLGEAIERVGWMRRSVAWMSAAVVLSPAPAPTLPSAHQEAPVPVGAVLSPALASAVLSRILRRRREQIAGLEPGFEPDRLTEDEATTLASVRRMAIEYDSKLLPDVVVDVEGATDPAIRKLLTAVERPSDAWIKPEVITSTDWRIVVKVFGYPLVENRSGTSAEFRKRRSLELLTWLVLNGDRQRRSAARTAMWDVDISDSTFSTVISDMRRGLAEVDRSLGARAWCPPTYSDEIPLSSSVVTDADLMAGALRDFKLGACGVETLLEYLSWIRDVPFAGTCYSWADLDGTTTRLVILAVDAANTVARWGREHDRTDVITVAVSAGLRVMPGCEELLEMQESVISASATRGSTRRRW